MNAAGPLQRFLFLRPTLGILLAVMFLFGGWLAWDNMAKEANPDLDIPIAMVQTEWPGADPETIEQAITEPLEEKLRSLKKLKKLRSASFNSFSLISVEFDAGADTSDAMNRLRTKVDEALPDLPADVKKPSVTQSRVDDTPVIAFALTGQVGPTALGRLALRLQDHLEKLAGVNEVVLSGNRDEIVLVRLLPSRLIALGLSPLKVRDAITQANQDMPWGQLEGDQLSGGMRLYGRFRDIENLRQTPVMRMPSGRVIYLREVAEVRRDLEAETSRAALSWMGGDFQPSIDLSVKKLSGVDTVKLIDTLKGVMAAERQGPDWPHGIDYRITADQSESIWENLNNVFNNGWQAMLGVFLVLLAVLSWREAVIAGLSIPLTFLATLMVVWMLGFTLNTLVIVGLVLALGLLVDVFILMMEGMHENIFTRRLSFGDAVLATIKTYAAPAFAGQMTTILAMAPLLAVGGVAGKFIQIVPLTTIVALVMSYLVALLVTVPLSRFLLARVDTDVAPSRMDRITKKASEKLLAWSRRVSLKSRASALAWVLGALALLIASLMLAGGLSSTMYPKADGRNLGVTVELPPDTTLEQSQACADALGEVLRAKPWLQSVVKFTGAKSPMALNSAAEALTPSEDRYLVGFSAYFKPKNDRDHMAYEYLDALRPELEARFAHCPGGQLTLAPQLGGASNEDPIQIIVSGEDLGVLHGISAKIQQALAAIPGATDVRDSMGPSTVDLKSLPRREALDFYQISVSDLARQMRIALASDAIGEFDVGGARDDLDIVLGTAWPSREGASGGPTSIAELVRLNVIANDGRAIPLFSLVDIDIGESPLVVGHDMAERMVTIKAKNDGATAGEILARLRPELDRLRASWPDGYTFRIGGEAEESAETFGDMLTMLGVALFLVFALLVIQFDSFRQPVIILASVPLALIGVFTAFYIGDVPISFPAMIGIIALVGIVVNNAIVMIDTMNGHFRTGRDRRQAAALGAAERLRPILATTITTVVGLTPLALSDPFWMPLCLAIISGLLVSTVISLVIVPCLYLLLGGRETAQMDQSLAKTD